MENAKYVKFRKVDAGTKNLAIALDPDASFDQIVEYLKEALVVPELPGVRGCRPCLSGLERLVVESRILPITR